MKHFLFNPKEKSKPKNYQEMIDVSSVKQGDYNGVEYVHLFGGDGTINNFINHHDVEKIILHRYGSGNDLLRSIDSCSSTFIYTANDNKFINSFGMGIDSHVCKVAREIGNKNYLKLLLKALPNFKKFDVKIIVDGEKHSFNNCYIVSVCNGKYLGKGIKIAPKAELEKETVDVVVIHDLFGLKIIWGLFLLMIQKHYLLKKNVFYKKASQVTIENNEDRWYQIDGEVKYEIKDIVISRGKPIKIEKAKTRQQDMN